MVALLALAIAALLALTASPAYALTTRQLQSQITEANGSSFGAVKGLAVDSSDRLWASDPAKHAVDRFGSTGSYEAQNTGAGSWEESPYIESLAFSAAVNEVFVSDSLFDDLWGLDPATAANAAHLNPGLGSCCFIQVAADNSGTSTAGDLYLSTGTKVLRIKASDGSADEFTAGPGAGTNELASPFSEATALAVAPNGDLYVAAPYEHKVYKFEPSGEFTGIEIGEPLDFLRALAVDPTTEDLLVDDGTNTVYEFAPAGSFLRRITKPGGASFHGVFGLAVDSTGHLYISEASAEPKLIDVFGPLITLPDVTTLPAEVHSVTEATLHGEVNPAGEPLTECFFEYGETTAYGQTAACEPEASAIPVDEEFHPVHADIANLNPGAEYHYRLVAANANGQNNESEDQTFVTGASIDATSAADVSATSATLEAELNPHGLPTTYHFEYDTAPYAEGEAPHGTPTPTGSAGAGVADVTRTAPIQGLAPGTIYHFRAVAQNSLGTVEGPDRSFTTQGAAASLLPDGRGWELVSPPDKGGVPLEGISAYGADIQAAADGSGLAYVAKGSIGPGAPGSRSFADSQLLAHRLPAGSWSTQDVTPAHESPQGLISGYLSEYKLFSADLSHAVVEPEGATPLSPAATERTPYRREPDGTYSPLLNQGNVPPGTHFGGNEFIDPEGNGTGIFREGSEFVGANPDLSALVLSSYQDLTEPSFDPEGIPSLYRWSAGALRLISQVPATSAGACGGSGPACVPAAALGLDSTMSSGFIGDQQVRNAVSTDGNRAVFATNEAGVKYHLWLRDLARGETLQLDALQSGAEGGRGEPVFQDASTDGSHVFFTDTSRLTVGSTAASQEPDLYECKIEVTGGHLACDLTDLTANALDPNEPAGVLQTVIGSAADGSSLYFAANGKLTAEPAANGEEAVRGDCTNGKQSASNRCNLYLRRGGHTTFIAVLSNRDAPDWGSGYAKFGELTARVSPNGRWLAFMSQRPLTGYDNRDARSGEPDEEVFLYDSQTAKLVCASCNPTGARPIGIVGSVGPLVDRRGTWTGVPFAANVPGWTDPSTNVFFYQSRYLSNSGRLFFNASDALVPQDSNGTEDVYQYEPAGVGSCTTASSTYSPKSEGCVDLISSGTSPEESAFLDASESGNDVFFLTASRLAPTDVDSALDVYDAHVCSAELPCPPPPPPSPPACAGDACQAPAVPPNDPTPGSLGFQGAGNVLQCPKGKVKRSAKCVARRHRKAKHGKKAHKRHARSKRGSGK